MIKNILLQKICDVTLLGFLGYGNKMATQNFIVVILPKQILLRSLMILTSVYYMLRLTYVEIPAIMIMK